MTKPPIITWSPFWTDARVDAEPKSLEAVPPLDPVPVVPLPVGGALDVKLAVTLFGAFIVNVQEPVPEHAPDQPVKTEPDKMVGVNVTVVPLL